MSQYAGNDYSGTGNPVTQGTTTVAHSAGFVVGACVLILVAVRLGYRDISLGKVTGGLVRG